eukprot:scaffold224_cov71-Phaeocystis_antarctica.AAC.4
MALVTSQRPDQPFGRTTVSPGPKLSVVGRGAAESQPPSVQCQLPTEAVPTLTRGRDASCGSPMSTFLRRPLGVSCSSAKYDSGSCVKDGLATLGVGAGSSSRPRLPVVAGILSARRPFR